VVDELIRNGDDRYAGGATIDRSEERRGLRGEHSASFGNDLGIAERRIASDSVRSFCAELLRKGVEPLKL